MIFNLRGSFSTIRTEPLHVNLQGLTQEVRELERRNDRISLACQALWELLKERTDLTEEDLQQRILDVDLRDGVADGKITQQLSECPECKRPTNSKRAYCIFCGAKLDQPNAFG